MSTLLIQRLYDIYGESFIPVDETPDELKGPRRIRVTKDLTIVREEDPVKHTDLNFDAYPNDVVTEAFPQLKAFHPDIESFVVIDDTVKTFAKDGKQLFTWKLKEKDWELGTITSTSIEKVISKHGSERVYIGHAPAVIIQWCKKFYPAVNYLKVRTEEDKWFLDGFEFSERNFTIEGDARDLRRLHRYVTTVVKPRTRCGRKEDR